MLEEKGRGAYLKEKKKEDQEHILDTVSITTENGYRS